MKTKCSHPKHKIDFGSFNLFTENGILRIIEEKYLSSLQVFAIVNFFAEYLKKKGKLVVLKDKSETYNGIIHHCL
jgi:hypothetical protein